MNWLRIRCFGQLDVTVNDVPLHDLHRSPTLRALLGYFVLHRDQVLTRWQVAGTFWPEKEDAQARRALNTLLWRFQQTGGGCLAVGLHLSRHTVRWSPPPGCWIDVAAFENLTLMLERVSRDLADENVLLELQQAVQLYRGPLLADVDAEWCAAPRALYHERYMLALEALVNGYERIGRPEVAVMWARQLVEADPYRESGHTALVRLNQALNRPAEAEAAYRHYARLWREELGLTPADFLQQEAEIVHQASGGWPDFSPDPLACLLELHQHHPVPGVETFFRSVVQAAERLAAEAESAGRWTVARRAYEVALGLLPRLPVETHQLRWELTLRLRCDRIYDLAASRAAQRENLRRALSVAHTLNDTAAESEVCARLCWVAQREGRLGEAVRWAEQALELAGEDKGLQAQGLRLLGSNYELQGLYATACTYHERALALDKGNPERQRLDHLNLCSVYTFAGNDWKAMEHAQAALALISEAPPSPLRALALGNLANVERALGDYNAAVRHVRQAQAIANMVGAQELRAWLAGRAAALYAQMGEIARARLWAAWAWNLSAEAHNITAQVEAGLVLGYIACLRKNLKEVRRWCQRIEPLLAVEGGNRYQAPALILKAHLYLLENRLADAKETVTQALLALEQSGEERRRVACLVLLALIAHNVGHHSAAEQHVAEARAALLDRANRIPDTMVRDRFCTATPLRRFLLAGRLVMTDVERVEDGELLVAVGRRVDITRAVG